MVAWRLASSAVEVVAALQHEHQPPAGALLRHQREPARQSAGTQASSRACGPGDPRRARRSRRRRGAGPGGRPRHTGSIDLREHEQVVAVGGARRHRDVEREALARPRRPLSPAAPVPGIERDTGAWRRRARAGRRRTLHCVPLPWWTSKSTIATRARAAGERVRGGDRDVVEQAEPHRLVAQRVVSRRPHEREGGAQHVRRSP